MNCQKGAVLPIVAVVVLVGVVGALVALSTPAGRKVGLPNPLTADKTKNLKISKFNVPEPVYVLDLLYNAGGNPALRVKNISVQKAILPESIATTSGYRVSVKNKYDTEIGRYPFEVPQTAQSGKTFAVYIPKAKDARKIVVLDGKNHEISQVNFSTQEAEGECPIPILLLAAASGPNKVGVAVRWLLTEQEYKKVVVLRDGLQVNEITDGKLKNGIEIFTDEHVPAGSHIYSAYNECIRLDGAQVKSDTVTGSPVQVNDAPAGTNPPATTPPVGPQPTVPPASVQPTVAPTTPASTGNSITAMVFDDAGPGMPAQGALITLSGNGINRSGRSGDSGLAKVTFDNLPAGSYEVCIAEAPSGYTINKPDGGTGPWCYPAIQTPPNQGGSFTVHKN